MSASSASADEPSGGSVTIIGTAHVSPMSLAEVQGTIEQQDPDVVAVELCGRRYVGPTPDGVPYAGDDMSAGVRTLLFLPLMQYIQSRTAAQRGLDEEVTDMGTAIEAAIETDADLALLDRDILQTFSRYWRAASVRETLRVVASIGMAIVRGDSTLLNTTPAEETDADAVDAYREKTEQTFPAFRTVFLDERDELMAARLAHLKDEGYDIVAVVGAAHKPGIQQALPDTITTDIEMLSTPVIDPRPDLYTS